MREYKNKRIVREERTMVKMTCDLCGKTTDRDEWTTSSYEINETKIQYRQGVSFPEYTNGTKICVDICPDCFMNKLIPWFTNQGVHIEEEDWEW
jgi:hypothetical protein